MNAAPVNVELYRDLLPLVAPEVILLVAALVALFVDLNASPSASSSKRLVRATVISGLGCLGSLLWIACAHPHARWLDGMFVADSLTQLTKAVLLVLTLLTLFISSEKPFTRHAGEYCALVLFATVGLMVMISSENLLLIFTALELASLSLYILTAFNKDDPASGEAAIKYFLFGGMAAAVMLYGISLLYGITHELNLARMAAQLKGHASDPLVLIALVMVVVGLGFKVAAVPFHLWAPDAYQGAPTASAALIASGSKLASFFLIARIMMAGMAGIEGGADWGRYTAGWLPLIGGLALLSVVFGNLAALAQSQLKRLLAYSAIGHAGYALLGIVADSSAGLTALLYYMITYALTAVGAFAVVGICEGKNQGSELGDFAGLGKRSPLLAACLTVFILSLAGIPPLPGFFGKFYLFSAALGMGHADLGRLWLVAAAVVMSAVSLYYYLQVLKQVYVIQPDGAARRVGLSPLSGGVLAVLAVGVVVLGIWPELLLHRLGLSVAAALGF